MLKFISINLDIHKSLLVDLNEEYISWIVSQLKEHYDVDIFNMEGSIQYNKIEKQALIKVYAKESVEKLTSYMPPEGIYYILQKSEKVVGMGGLRKINASVGEIKRMYIRPEYRGKDFGKELLQLIVKKAKEFRFTTFRFETVKFMITAQYIYHQAGFREIDEYAEVETPLPLQPYWLFMEKKI
ncbi:MAG: GNAT family N-acetyltransferase [Candidatus Thorarchaeota archaeon]